MKKGTKIGLIVGGILLAGAAFYYFKNRSLRKKYKVIKNRTFEITLLED